MSDSEMSPASKTSDVHRLVSSHCRKCGGEMTDGTALIDVYGGVPDFDGCEVVTMSPTGKAKLVHCLKCETCGHSVTYG